MLQHNAQAPSARNRAHLAHAAVVLMHSLCCGLPALALIAVALSGAASGVALFANYMENIHHFFHSMEGWILGVSAALVVSGGVLELLARRGAHTHGFPWLFALSVLCFVINVAIILVHRA